MKTINSILKQAENICKPLGEQQDQISINKMMIAMRYAIDEVQKWVPIEKLQKEDVKVFLCNMNCPEDYYVGYLLDDCFWSYETGAELEGITHYRQIEIS